MQHTRPAAVAGTFYPGEAQTLQHEVERYLAQTSAPHPNKKAKALIVPHAGYVYSGPVAASAYSQLAARKKEIRKVILLGPAHHVPIRGIALPAAEALATPLGSVAIDEENKNKLMDLPFVFEHSGAHAPEHSLEVHLPFLQVTLEQFTVLPLLIGFVEPEAVDDVLERVWGGDETLIVVSSDLSHYLSYRDAKLVDENTVQHILALQHHSLDHHAACGATPINGMVIAARKHHLHPELLDLRNSGDTAGPHDRVVGYTAIAFYPEKGAAT